MCQEQSRSMLQYAPCVMLVGTVFEIKWCCCRLRSCHELVIPLDPIVGFSVHPKCSQLRGYSSREQASCQGHRAETVNQGVLECDESPALSVLELDSSSFAASLLASFFRPKYLTNVGMVATVKPNRIGSVNLTAIHATPRFPSPGLRSKNGTNGFVQA
mmetsp:Transcript_7409/g.20040  ORF Transcript_7409/g.20040 Transcript_7409/m.20040 type:complete len:159 (-) Transcript_7409:823-1299(-)